MQGRRVLILILLALSLPLTSAWAQRAGRISILGQLGAFWPQMDHPKTERFDTHPVLAGGASVNYGANDYLGFQFGVLSSAQEARTGPNEHNRLTMHDFTLQMRWNILTGIVQPYLLLGVEYYILSLDPPLEDETDPGITGGAGLEFLLYDHFSFGVSARYSMLYPEHFGSAALCQAMGYVAFAF